MILFLDFDGVLHPARAYMGHHGPKLAGDGSLFMWADLLVEFLNDYPHVQIVLSTSWVRHLPFDQVCDFLPLPMRRRVVGSTWHNILNIPEFSRNLPFSYWQDATRYQQVRRWVTLYHVQRWVAIDDDSTGWDDVDRLIQTNGETGLSGQGVIERLSKLLGRK